MLYSNSSIGLAARGESTTGRVPSAAGADARRCDAGDVGVHRRGAPTQQMPPRRRNPKGAWGLRCDRARIDMRALALLVVNDVLGNAGVARHQPPPRALSSPRKPHARDTSYYSDRLLEFAEGHHVELEPAAHVRAAQPWSTLTRADATDLNALEESAPRGCAERLRCGAL
jgi:hypothetical protein